ncbi:putative bifunctional diguanylate cyclase/phosphodiesterase [Halomonas daqiaonensis]|uniref:Diguanylate cyclase (GGDEF) domain-containing protein n=1 Tax=Halomonas daqiaonensis TaxID=650850 RepID=A0A1H7MS09_9GAMM|nr:EAL domain-containing protein [Halomonas daqiaonensis]SEL14080.1 diguanylate cyclase (GGDEF) domain-containing protein [Halomonas daqiaonensis]
MKLVRLSVISITACVMGLIALVLVGLHSMGEMHEKQAEIKALMDLHHRIGEFSVASDALLTNRVPPSRLASYRDEAVSLKQTLSTLSDDHPGARRAIHHIDFLVGTLSAVYSQSARLQEGSDAQRQADSPLLLSLHSQAIMNQVADYGIELDTALREVTIQRQAQIARDANWIAASFAGAAVMFGLFCVAAFGLLFKRINGPLRTLSQAVQRVEAGEHGVHVPVSGSDEFADLSRTFNRMLDQQESMVETLSGALATRRALIDSLPAHIALLNETGKILDVNNQWRHFGTDNDQRDATFGVGSNYLAVCRAADGDCAEEALEAADGLQAVLAGDRDAFALEYPCHSPDQPRWFRMMATRLIPAQEAQGFLGAVVMHVDITERKLAEQELKRQAYEDPLTGIANRLGFIEAFSRHLDRHGWNPQDIVALLDIREMRSINDAHGYHVGDQLLIEMARRLGEHLSDNTLLGRISGDQFIVLLPGDDASRPYERLDQLANIFHQPIHLSELIIEIEARGGYTMLGEDERSAEALLHEVEIALHETRRRDNSQFHSYDREMDRRAQQRIDLTRELRVALENDQFELHFQPKVDLATGTMIGCEALIRWAHPERGMQMPGQFIPVAEQSQLIGPIGEWVLFEACRHLREWQEAGLDLVRVSVNVSVDQFRLGDFTHKVREALETYTIDPAALTLEITESVFSEESETLRRQLNDLHALGVRLSLDDFGTGYSSLLYLQRYTFDEIKIDMGFVRRILDEPLNRNLVSMILGISEVLGADTVAEGVENTAVRDALLELGCRIGQGYYYSMPLEVEDFRWLLEKHSRLPLAPPTPTDTPL